MRLLKIHRRTNSQPVDVAPEIQVKRQATIHGTTTTASHDTVVPTSIRSSSPTGDDIEDGTAPLTANASKARIKELEALVAQLEEANRGWKQDCQDTRNELLAIRVDFFSARQQDRALDAERRALEDKIGTLERVVSQFENLVAFMVDIGLHEPVLGDTRRLSMTIQSGQSADDMLVDAIKSAAAQPESPWARIMPAITGPRTPEQYTSAINMTLKARKELSESKALVQFWKKTAQEGDEHADVITPSPSQLPLALERLDQGRQTAVDDLLAQLHRGERPRLRYVHGSETEADVPEAGTTPKASQLKNTPADMSDVFTPPDLEVAAEKTPESPAFSSPLPNLVKQDVAKPLKKSPVKTKSAHRFSMHVVNPNDSSINAGEDSYSLLSLEHLPACFQATLPTEQYDDDGVLMTAMSIQVRWSGLLNCLHYF